MPDEYPSALARKLNIRRGMRVRVLGAPPAVELAGLEATDAEDADAIVLFAHTLAEVDAGGEPVLRAAVADRIAWIAYPKGGQLGTDMNRDILWSHMVEKGVRAVRQIAIDGVWSAIRFRGGPA